MEMNLPNKLTLLRVVMIPVFVVVLLTDMLPTPMNRYVALAIFVIASLTDLLDGKIARKYNLVTNFGKFADPLADKLLVTAAMICLTFMGELSPWVVILIISREFIVTGFRLIAAEAGIVIAASMWGKIKTVVQMLMVIVLLPGIQTSVFPVLGGILEILAAILTVISGVDYILKNKQVLKG